MNHDFRIPPFIQINHQTTFPHQDEPRLDLMTMAATYYFLICGLCPGPFTFLRYAPKSETLGAEIALCFGAGGGTFRTCTH